MQIEHISKEANYSESIEASEERRADFLRSIDALTPSLADLADIEEQVIFVEEGVDPDDTPIFRRVRDYTTEEKRLIRRGLRGNAAVNDQHLLFSPLVPAEEQSNAAKSYIDYVKGRASMQTRNERLAGAFPHIIATYALAHKLYPDEFAYGLTPSHTINSETVGDFADKNPEYITQWTRYGRLRTDEILQSYPQDHTVRISSEMFKTYEFSCVEASLQLSGKVMRDIRDYGDNLDLLDRHNTHNEGMLAFKSEGYRYSPQPESIYFDYFIGYANWLQSYINPGLPIFDENLDRDFKLHLMPKEGETVDVVRGLLQALKSNETFGESIIDFKVHSQPVRPEEAKKYPTPDIVIYPVRNVEAIGTALAGLRKVCSGRAGSGITPRFNIPDGSSTILFIAEGQGHDKAKLANSDKVYLGSTYNAAQNYAFQIGDETVVADILQYADQVEATE